MDRKRKTKRMRRYRVAVYYTPDDGRWAGYTLWFNESWDGFCGMFEVEADSHAHAVRAAINAAKANASPASASPR